MHVRRPAGRRGADRRHRPRTRTAPPRARQGGAPIVVVDDEDIVEVVDGETSGELADVVVDVSGSPQAVLASVDCLRLQGTLVLAGLSGSTTTTPMLLDRIVWKELRIQAPSPPTAMPSWPHCAWSSRRASPSRTWSHTFPLEETVRCIEAIEGLHGPLPNEGGDQAVMQSAQRFIDDVRAVHHCEPDLPARWQAIEPLLRQLLQEPELHTAA